MKIPSIKPHPLGTQSLNGYVEIQGARIAKCDRPGTRRKTTENPMSKTPVTIFIATLAASAAGIAAQPQLISQDRYVRVPGTEVNAVGFGLFDESINWSQDVPPDAPCIRSSESASQQSEITTAGFFADGSNGESDGTCRLPADGRGFGPPSQFEFDFSVAEQTELALSGNLRAGLGGFDPPGVPTGSAIFSVSSASGTVAQWNTGGIDQLNVNFNDVLILEPGTYTVRAAASANAFVQSSGSASYSIVGAFANDACPADLNDDDVLDLADLQLFVQAFLAADPLADFDDNGIYDLADIQGFIAAFNAGCP